jgi:hypothetical protein
MTRVRGFRTCHLFQAPGDAERLVGTPVLPGPAGPKSALTCRRYDGFPSRGQPLIPLRGEVEVTPTC